MPAAQYHPRIDTLELKMKIEMRLGRSRADKYFSLLSRFLSLKISKSQFHKLCVGTMGRENVHLHNNLMRSIMTNACVSKTPPSKERKVEGSPGVEVTNGCQTSSLQSLCKGLPQSPKKVRTPSLRDRRCRGHTSPLGPNGKNHNIACEGTTPKSHDLQSEILSMVTRPHGSVEDGEEVDQASGSPGIYCRSPVKAPLGIPMHNKRKCKVLPDRIASGLVGDTCFSCGELPDTNSLLKRLDQKLEEEGLKVPVDCANLFNNALNVYLKGLIKPCLEIASSKSGHKHIAPRQSCVQPGMSGKYVRKNVEEPSGPLSASILDFETAVELNPMRLGVDWPILLEKVALRASED